MVVVVLGIFGFAVAAMRIQRYFGIPKWQVSAGLIALGAILYIVNITLIQYFIKRRAPEFASNEPVMPGMQAWELTAGTGIVPRWVSILGLPSISALITGVLPWVVGLFR